ncbi:hypothetical protein HYH03_017465 [Edaphochlamys debaryana]|uniref:Uncharacterized protein n=1 Tax=Edaphochlamys debaryana TaxID=47281 RepID=A0A835XFK9_9CHLO|nr:hypothetical protein HYH03_017465 [Edaphochlamys debaryana]|eukprot:KAG2483662.1 hypothetical protein HYH03_017465 [Edaphochlamys debaryana]
MAEVAAAAGPPAAVDAAARLRKELSFVQSLLKSGQSLSEMVAAANASVAVAAKAVGELRRAHPESCSTELTIRGLPSGSDDWDWRGLKRWLTNTIVGDNRLSAKSIRHVEKDADKDVGVLRLANEDQIKVAMDLLATVDPPVAGSALTLQRGPAPEYSGKKDERENRKRGREGEEQGQAQGERPAGGRGPKAPRAAPNVCEATCPLWRTPYPEQLRGKLATVVGALGKITDTVERRTHADAKPTWIQTSRALSRDTQPACPLLGVLRSPVIEAYRNKSEFTCGMDEQERPSVGFLRGSFIDGITCVGSPNVTRHTSKAAIAMADAASDFLRQGAQFPVWDKRYGSGFWRLVVVREGRRRSFLPLPLAASALAADEAGARAGQQVLADPTFPALDPWRYLVTSPSSASGAYTEEQWAEALPDGASSETRSREEGVARGMALEEVCEAEPAMPPPDELLVMLQVNPQYSRALAEPELARADLRNMAAALTAAATAAGLPAPSFAVQHHHGVSNAAPYDAPIVHLDAAVREGDAMETGGSGSAGGEGPGYIHDSLCELRFRISPTAFFQVNSSATCVLYKVVGDWAVGCGSSSSGSPPSTLLLDVCCGTGTIGLSLAHRVAKVVGVDSVESAVEDARANAALNGITNAEFVAGKAEMALPSILAQHAEKKEYSEVVAIVDPPRAGLHKSVLAALRGCGRIRRLVYVACNPESLAQNVGALCAPNPERRGGYGGHAKVPPPPFRPVKAVAMDLFPHTHHVESVMLLER